MSISGRLRVLVAFGTRPEAIKLAPVVAALRQSDRFDARVVVTAQHREMLDQVLDLFGIEPDFDLDIQRHGQTLAEVTVRAITGLEPIMADQAPDLVLVQGDTTTTLGAALTAFYQGIPVGHVEAGLRTGNPRSPFPEEINRRLTTQLTSLHLAPTATNVANLQTEGVDRESVVCTGNTVIDALLGAVGQHSRYGDDRLEDLDSDPRRVILVTVHRRESWGPTMDGIGRALARIAADPKVLLVVPIHLNPTVRQSVLPPLSGLANVKVVEPLAYGGFTRLMNRADLVLTDSGGIQEEAPSLGKPVLVLRDTTERPEAVEAGTVRLIGTDEDEIFRHARVLLDDSAQYRAMAHAVNPYGDGAATPRILAAIEWYFGRGPRPQEFQAPARELSG